MINVKLLDDIIIFSETLSHLEGEKKLQNFIFQILKKRKRKFRCLSVPEYLTLI